MKRPRLAFLYLTDLRGRSADVIQSLEMCDALEAFFRVRFYHPAITRKRVTRELDYWDVDATWELRRLATFGPNRIAWLDYPSRVAFLSQALLDLRVRPVDLIFTRDPSLLYFLCALPAFMRPAAPIIYEAHKLYHRVSSRVGSPAGEARAATLARHVVAISPGVRDDLLALGIDPGRIDVLPLGVKLERFEGRKDKAALKIRLGLDPARPVVVYSGSWDQWKGVETLVDAFAHLAKSAHLANSKSGAILLLIGLPDSIAATFMAKLSAMGIAEDRVILHGHLPRRELARWLCAADVGVVPNNDTLLSAHYTSPLKVFEYLAAGLAVVASDVPALRAVLGDREAVFVRAGDALDMAEKLGRLLQSHVDRQDRQSAARQRAINFDYAVRAERILAIYYNLSGQAKVR